MKLKILSLLVLMALAPVIGSSVYADSTYTEKLEFGAGLEETLGHFWAIEQNLDDNNAVLALVHATHPVAELYDAMKPTLVATSPSLDAKVSNILDELGAKTDSRQVTRADADKAIADAKEVVAIARNQVIGPGWSDSPNFKLELMKTLLETSIAEYEEAVADGVIGEMAEFQDGSAFVWRAGVIFEEVEDAVPEHEAHEIEELFEDVNAAYNARADPSEVATLTGGILHEIDEIRAEKIEFGAGLEETLGHFWAIEQNLDDNNAVLALVHATHPVAELYDAMKPTLVATSPSLDAKVSNILDELGAKTDSRQVTRADADKAIADAKEVVAIARNQVIGPGWSDSPNFKLELMKTLLETSIAEYEEAVADGVIGEMAEFQDGSAFVWRAGVIFEEVEDAVPEHEAHEIEELFEDVNAAYNARADPSEVATLTGGILHEIDEILGTDESEGDQLGGYVNTIIDLLTRADAAYPGDKDLALSLVTKAYLDNYEFLESPLVNAGEEELMEDIEHEMREELRNMIKRNYPASQVSSQIDSILAQMDTAASVLGVPSGEGWKTTSGGVLYYSSDNVTISVHS